MGSIPWSEEEGEYHRDLDTMDRWSVAEIGKHWLSVTDLSTDFTRSASIEAHRIGHRARKIELTTSGGWGSILLGASVSNV